MPDPEPNPRLSAPLTRLLEPLSHYGPGSSRAALLAIDEAAIAAARDEAERAELERALLAVLQGCKSDEARAYILSKLALVGSEKAVSAAKAFLHHPVLSTAARGVLENVPSESAEAALRESLPGLAGYSKIGVVNSMAVRGGRANIRALEAVLQDAGEEAVLNAAAAALGRIGGVQSAQALKSFISGHLKQATPAIVDAALVGAEGLLRQGEAKQAEQLLQALAVDLQPSYLRESILRCLEAARLALRGAGGLL